MHALSLQVESDPLKNIMHVSILKKKMFKKKNPYGHPDVCCQFIIILLIRI